MQVPRGHVEHLALKDLAGGEDQEQPETVAVKLGVRRSKTRSRRDRLSAEQQTALNEIGL